MDALNKALADKGIKPEPTSRFFFNRYPFRITFDAEKYSQDTTTAATRAYHVGHRWRLAGSEMIERIEPIGEVKVRHQGGYVSVYFNDVTDVLRTVDVLGSYILSVATPASDKEFEVMASDTRVEIRDTLYWGKYRWVATFKTLTVEQANEVTEWLRNFKEMNGDEDRSFISFSNPPRAYFTDENDLFYFRVVFYQHISRIEKALLKKEIADEHLASEGSCAA